MDDLRMSRRMLKSSGSSQFRTRSRDLRGESFGHVSWTAHDPLSTVDFPAGLPTGPATVVSGAAVDGRSWQSRA
jgi:hypothetical protein